MSEFHLYYKLGLDHIFNFENYDHTLFILSLVVIYNLKQWIKVLILLTSFTLGHCMSLLLFAVKAPVISTGIIHFIVPGLILLTAFSNLFQKSDKFLPGIFSFRYFLSFLFAVIQGMTFSSTMELLPGRTIRNILPFFFYNLGVESGQLAVFLILIALSLLIVDLLKFKRREWILFVSGAAIGISLLLMAEKYPWG